MPRIDPNFLVHMLNIDPNFCLVKQKRREFNAEQYEVIKIQVEKLLKASFTTEVHYPTWLSNVALV